MIRVVFTALIAVGLVFGDAEPVAAQKKGQSAKVSYGVVVKSERVDLSDDKTTKGALVGGTIGLATGGSSGYKRRRNAAIGAASGAIVGSAASTSQMGMMYTVETAGGAIKVVTRPARGQTFVAQIPQSACRNRRRRSRVSRTSFRRRRRSVQRPKLSFLRPKLMPRSTAR
jgi:hypothetical protein